MVYSMRFSGIHIVATHDYYCLIFKYVTLNIPSAINISLNPHQKQGFYLNNYKLKCLLLIPMVYIAIPYKI